MKRLVFALLVLTLTASPSRAAGLKLTIRDGKVSLDAQQVTIGQILTEWARVGKTRILNLERVSSGPMTLKFDDIPEAQALDIILRTVPGYLAAPRAAIVPDASIYDRILIMATTTAVPARPASASAQQPFQTPPFQPPFQTPPNVTQLRMGPPTNPGILPESPATANDNGPNMNDPAIAAAAAAGLIAVPGSTPGAFDSMRTPVGPPRPLLPGATPPTGSTTTPVFTAPTGTPLPGPPTPSPTPPVRPALIAPPQADR
ncbi:MAG TPA: hypothetical protein VGZ27_17450 [Vicinamibacterales bacterium]|jgi:hypothetical protein|nr:hypothetical protein [Vicinamibacterales bacterium]